MQEEFAIINFSVLGLDGTDPAWGRLSITQRNVIQRKSFHFLPLKYSVREEVCQNKVCLEIRKEK